jgi:hypothetical protein
VSGLPPPALRTPQNDKKPFNKPPFEKMASAKKVFDGKSSKKPRSKIPTTHSKA